MDPSRSPHNCLAGGEGGGGGGGGGSGSGWPDVPERTPTVARARYSMGRRRRMVPKHSGMTFLSQADLIHRGFMSTKMPAPTMVSSRLDEVPRETDAATSCLAGGEGGGGGGGSGWLDVPERTPTTIRARYSMGRRCRMVPKRSGMTFLSQADLIHRGFMSTKMPAPTMVSSRLDEVPRETDAATSCLAGGEGGGGGGGSGWLDVPERTPTTIRARYSMGRRCRMGPSRSPHMRARHRSP